MFELWLLCSFPDRTVPSGRGGITINKHNVHFYGRRGFTLI